MCGFAVDLHAVGAGADFSKGLEQLDALSASGIVHHNGRHVVVTEKGRPFVRVIAAVFDAYLARNHKRQSIAV